jgi:hypothetical protein
MRFIDLLPAVERAHAATRLVIQGTGCQLAASLLTLDLDRRRGVKAEYVRGYYSALPEQEHWWVEAESLLLDPTRDQFSEDPFAEHYAGAYTRADAKPASKMEYEATKHLRLQWSSNRRVRDAIKQVAAQYRLDLSQIMEPPGLFMPVPAPPDGA